MDGMRKGKICEEVTFTATKLRDGKVKKQKKKNKRNKKRSKIGSGPLIGLWRGEIIRRK